jgi:hypothetical protein
LDPCYTRFNLYFLSQSEKELTPDKIGTLDQFIVQ